MRVLLVYPRNPDTFFSFSHIVRMISKKASHPPLGLLTVAAMLPAGWEKKLVDMNVTDLTDQDILWADYVFLSAMQVQIESTKEVIRRCNQLGRKVVAGGPLFAASYDEFAGVDHFVLGEAEVTLAPFLADLENGRAKAVYASAEKPDLTHTPVPLWSLIDISKYGTMSVQYSRGCPFDCEFCDIVFLNGHTPRTKDLPQLLGELDALYHYGWRGQVFFVDDNFIGNKNRLKTELLPGIVEWQKRNKYPFYFMTQASINLADDEELMRLMAEAGFTLVFVGIESSNEASLDECGKRQNTGRDMLASVRTMHNHGLEVMGGFIVGFDSDPASIFDQQIDFIEKGNIIVAMVSMLNAPRGTRLYQRLKAENRILDDTTGGYIDWNTNFVTKIDRAALASGCKHIIDTVYSPRAFYQRVLRFFAEYHPPKTGGTHVEFNYLISLLKCLWLLGVVEKGRGYFWRLLAVTAVRYPERFWRSIMFSIERVHFYQHARELAAAWASAPDRAMRPGLGQAVAPDRHH